jgi:hypothetical protein
VPISTAAALSSRGTYDAGPALVKNCVLYQRGIELLVPKACGSVAMTGVDYPVPLPHVSQLAIGSCCGRRAECHAPVGSSVFQLKLQGEGVEVA